MADDWQRLAAADDDAVIFNDWSWNRLWWSHYSHLGQLHVLVVYRGEKIVGIGPFYRTKATRFRLLKIDTLKFLGSGGDTSPDDLNVLANPLLRQDVTNVMCEHLLGADAPLHVHLAEVPVATAFFATFTAKAQEAKGYSIKPLVKTRHSADLPAKWEQYREQISRNTHKQIKRRRNRLQKAGNSRFRVCESLDDLDRVSQALVELHKARWFSKNEVGSFQSSEYVSFHQTLMRSLFERDQLLLLSLELDGKIIAVEYAFFYKKSVLFFQTGFDPEYEHLSPGHLLLTFGIEKAIEMGAKQIDLLMGDYAYKSSYANQIKLTADIGFYRAGVYSLLARAKDVVKRHTH